jgi:hypothetical protein
MDLADIRLDLITDDRKVRERRIQDLILELFVAFEDVAEHCDRDQEEREQAHKSVVRDQRRKVAAAVVAELLDDRETESRRAEALLKPIDRANDHLYVRHAFTDRVGGGPLAKHDQEESKERGYDQDHHDDGDNEFRSGGCIAHSHLTEHRLTFVVQ